MGIKLRCPHRNLSKDSVKAKMVIFRNVNMTEN